MSPHTDKRIDAALSTLMDHAPLAPEFPEPVCRSRRGPAVVVAVLALAMIAVGVSQVADPDDDAAPVVAAQPPAGPTAKSAVAEPPESQAGAAAIVLLPGSGTACEPAGLLDVIRELGVATVTTHVTSGAHATPVVYAGRGFENAAQRIADLFDPAAPVEPLAEAGTSHSMSLPEVNGTEPTVVVALGPDCG